MTSTVDTFDVDSSYKSLREQLLTDRLALLAHVVQIDSDAADWVHQASEQRRQMLSEGDTISVERSINAQLSATARQTLSDIDAALFRMENGTYGKCSTCSNEIPVERLEVRPYALTCVHCAKKR